MPQTPAWPPASRLRLFVDQPLATGLTVTIAGGQAHYLAQVMRVKPGDIVMLFDDLGGEWAAQVDQLAKRTVSLTCVAHSRPREAVPDLWLAAAPIRRARFDWVAEKACELGVARFVPVMTSRAVVDKVRCDRLRATMIEAAEQCGRTALPEIDAPIGLAVWLKGLNGRTLFFADENLAESARVQPDGGEVHPQGLAAACRAHAGPAALLIGPEGGFTPEEQALVRAAPGTVAVSLGPRILRADTAAIAAVAVWMAAQVDRG